MQYGCVSKCESGLKIAPVCVYKVSRVIKYVLRVSMVKMHRK